MPSRLPTWRKSPAEDKGSLQITAEVDFFVCFGRYRVLVDVVFVGVAVGPSEVCLGRLDEGRIRFDGGCQRMVRYPTPATTATA